MRYTLGVGWHSVMHSQNRHLQTFHVEQRFPPAVVTEVSWKWQFSNPDVKRFTARIFVRSVPAGDWVETYTCTNEQEQHVVKLPSPIAGVRFAADFYGTATLTAREFAIRF